VDLLRIFVMLIAATPSLKLHDLMKVAESGGTDREKYGFDLGFCWSG